MIFDRYIHTLDAGCDAVDMVLNNPFEYQPHSLVYSAQATLIGYIDSLATSDRDIFDELERGKMFGVMIVRDTNGREGFLAAFSGCIAGRLEVDGFVPPICGREQSSGVFADEEQQISDISKEIMELESLPLYTDLVREHKLFYAYVGEELKRLQNDYTSSKERRKRMRQESPDMSDQLHRESQHQRGEMRRRVAQLKGELAELEARLSIMRGEIERRKELRGDMSNALQRKMFERFRVVNGRGEWRSLYDIFDELLHRLPPSGAGECAAPKLLQYALVNNLKPLSLGEFWYGGSSRGEVRHHGHFYGACRGRCYPILTYMLQGLDVAAVAVERVCSLESSLGLIYEDNYLAVFNKPSGMLSVPGRSTALSLKSIVNARYPQSDSETMIVHRLDQDTSGVIVVAKSADIHKSLQRQFSERKLSKRYVAVVEGSVLSDEGDIYLPLRPNIDDRPRQMVDRERGKAAHTTYRVLNREEGRTRLELYPHTGRTHQLRLHCAHVDGLAAPIMGDRLYGVNNSTRLHLHAESITFNHPISREDVTFSAPMPF